MASSTVRQRGDLVSLSIVLMNVVLNASNIRPWLSHLQSEQPSHHFGRTPVTHFRVYIPPSKHLKVFTS